ncbi:4-hydroxybenzoyl-CoA thioesterase [Azospirillum sp. TSH100]|nr:4-hydroxybenzoyl-CoA thioesterase [Azospirillum sp. TSH100]QCG91643.1 acyl-CoA thioesterase [Azospirillum sp. TSH100]
MQRPIRFSHCDPAGIVYFPVYFDMFNGAVEDWFTQGLDIDYATMILQRRLGLPIVHAECDFVIPSRMGDTLTLGVLLERLGRSSVQLRINGEHEGQVRLSGSLTLVTTSLDDFAAVAIPEDIRAAMERYQAGCEG